MRMNYLILVSRIVADLAVVVAAIYLAYSIAGIFTAFIFLVAYLGLVWVSEKALDELEND